MQAILKLVPLKKFNLNLDYRKGDNIFNIKLNRNPVFKSPLDKNRFYCGANELVVLIIYLSTDKLASSLAT